MSRVLASLASLVTVLPLATSAALALGALGCPAAEVVPTLDAPPAAEPPPPPGPPLRPLLSDADLQRLYAASPAGRYAAGERRVGALDLMDPQACAREPIETAFLMATPPMRVQLVGATAVVPDRRPGSARALSVGPAAEGFRAQAQALLALLAAQGDPLVAGRHVCLGLGVFEAPNAVSNALGYLVFDPQLFFDINDNPKRTLYSGDALLAHELAHQLQYWAGDPTLGDGRGGVPYARRVELQADCVAGALLAAQHRPEIGSANWDFSKGGIRAAVAAVGDLLVEEGGHHGTPGERDRAAGTGVLLGERALAAELLPPHPGLQSQALLDACRGYIDAMDAQYNHPWPDDAPIP